MKKKNLAIGAIAALAVSAALTGCSFGGSGGEAVTPVSLEGTKWESVSGTLNGQEYDLGDYTVEISFKEGMASVETMGELEVNPYQYENGAGVIDDDLIDLNFTVEGHEMKLVSNGIITLKKK